MLWEYYQRITTSTTNVYDVNNLKEIPDVFIYLMKDEDSIIGIQIIYYRYK